jgi:hypothetical protein
MKRMILVAAVLATAGGMTSASFAQPAPATITAQQWHGGGGWKPSAKAAVAGQQWHVDALRASENTLRGRVTVLGMRQRGS